MPKKSRVSDEQIIELIEAGLNNSEIARKLEVTTGSISVRCAQLRKKHAALEGPTEVQPPVTFDDLQTEDRFLYKGHRFIVRKKEADMIRVENMTGAVRTLSKDQFNKMYKGCTKVPPGDPKAAPVIVSKIEPAQEVGDLKVNGQAIKDLPEKTKEYIAEQLVKKAMEPEPGPEPKGIAAAAAETRHNDGMMAKAYMIQGGGVFPQLTPLETRIMARAHKEIEAFKKTRNLIQEALDAGDRLPGTTVDQYNRIVSKYQKGAEE